MGAATAASVNSASQVSAAEGVFMGESHATAQEGGEWLAGPRVMETLGAGTETRSSEVELRNVEL